MSNSNENSNDANPPESREQIPSDSPGTKESGEKPSQRDLDYAAIHDLSEQMATLATDIEDEAEQRAELDGATDDGLSPVYMAGNFRFVTPCHSADVGLRASKICPACRGNLDKPVDTAIPLVCGHYAVVTFASGDRVTPCPTCGEPSIVRAEQVIITRYFAREMTHVEQLRFMGLQT
jgi:hypothetical protein